VPSACLSARQQSASGRRAIPHGPAGAKNRAHRASIAPDRTEATMYAQVIELRLAPERLEALERLVRYELVPALRQQSGFCGALNLTDRERAETLLLLLWETEDEAARPLARSAAPFGRALATVTEVLASRSCSVTVWEVDARA
jgi:hypothetical protein